MEESKKQKKILFFGIGFYDYEKAIKESLERKDITVDYINTWEKLPFSKIVSHLNSPSQEKRLQKRLLGKISLLNENSYDFVLVIKGDIFTEEILKKLRSQQGKAKFILYEWDSVERFPFILKIKSYFDSVFSFDFNDCDNYGFKYRPLFSREYCTERNEKNIDLFFLGWAHSNRIKLLNNLFIKYRNSEKKLVFKILVGKIQYIRILINKRLNKEFKKECLILHNIDYKDYLNYLKRARAVLDLCHPEQSGLTMRTIETVSMNDFLYTTNKNISKERDIPSNQYKIIEDMSEIDLSAPISFPVSKFEKYRIEQFLDDLFGEKSYESVSEETRKMFAKYVDGKAYERLRKKIMESEK